MKTKEQLLEEGAYVALNAFRDRCPSYLPQESQAMWRRGFGGACVRIIREALGARQEPLPQLAAVVRLTWRERLRVALTGRAEVSIEGKLAIVGELRGVLPDARARFTAPPVLASWRVGLAERRHRQLQRRAERRAADIAQAEAARAAREAEQLPPAQPVTPTEP